jgi:citrate lyase subunit beta/citryl-CoA lyase
VLLPKLESATTVRQAEAILRSRPEISLWCQLETPRGILAAEGIAGASPRNTALVIGTSDLTKDLRARTVPSRAPLAFALSRVVLVARAYGLDAIDGVHLALDDPQGFERSSEESVAMGFDGRSLIHPGTLEAAHRIYGPSPDAVAHAEALVAAFREAEARGEEVVVHQGSMIERLHLEAAERIITLGRLASRSGS